MERRIEPMNENTLKSMVERCRLQSMPFGENRAIQTGKFRLHIFMSNF